MGGGPSTIDIWDLKPGASTGGPFKPISTSADGVQICEHMPMMAKQMHHMPIVRSMSTREADHDRGRYYMHTGYVPNPNIEHPSYGSVIAHELYEQVKERLEIPPFVSVGGGSEGPGFLGMTWAPFVVGSNGEVRNLNMRMDANRVYLRQQMLAGLGGAVCCRKYRAAQSRRRWIRTRYKLCWPGGVGRRPREGPGQDLEPDDQQADGGVQGQQGAAGRSRPVWQHGFGRGCLMARRLVEAGVPFVEVDLGGWDNHAGIFPILQNQKLPELDKAMSALVEDLAQRGLLDTPRSSGWASSAARRGSTATPAATTGRGSWSVVVGGGGMKGGMAVGETNGRHRGRRPSPTRRKT